MGSRSRILDAELAGSGVTDLQVTDMWGAGHGYWMPKLRVVESRICEGCGGFGLGGERFVPPGCGGFWA